MGDKKFSLKKWWTNSKIVNKLKKIKHIQIYIALVFIVVILLIYFSTFSSKKTTNTTQTSSTIEQYVSTLESRMGAALSEIKGAGTVSVMITLSSGTGLILAETNESKTINSGGNSTITVSSQPVIISKNGVSSPVVLSETLPEIKGVIVVSSGAANAKVKLELIKAVQALLDVPSGSIEVFEGK